MNNITCLGVGFIIGLILTLGVILFLAGIPDIIEACKDTIIAIDDFKRWRMKRAKIEVSNDLKDIEEWMNKKEVKDVIGSREFGVWLRHRVSAELDRKIEEHFRSNQEG